MSEIKSQKERLEEIVKTNKNRYTMKDVVFVFTTVFEGYAKQSKTVAEIKKKITKEEWNSLVNGLTCSFLFSLHAYKLPLDEALKVGMTEGVIGIGIATSKKDDKKDGSKK